MKISYNWLKEYITADLSPEKMGEILTAIGLEVEAIERVEAIPGGLKGVVVGEVLTCEKHPDADRLHVTTVSLGDTSTVQIVCGAPNVAAGQKVLVATVGTVLHPTSGESFTIKKSKIRGVESIGMICAEDELGLGASHAGIMVLDASAVPGTPAAEVLGMSGDYSMEIGLTPNRTDAFSHYGVARDLAAALRNMHGLERYSFELKRPSLFDLKTAGNVSSIGVEVQDYDACPRYAGIVVSGIRVAPSPKWLSERLAVIGLRPINNVVDITNYIQHELGQPLHAFDAERITGGKVVVRKAHTGEKFVTLDGVERELSAEDLMICNATDPMCIAGVFGGLDSGVTDTTTSIFIESAYFHPTTIRKTARRHGLNTDASFRFERGCDPQQVIPALERAAYLLKEIAGATDVSAITDLYPQPIALNEINFRWAFASRLIGVQIPDNEIRAILRDLDFGIVSENEEGLVLSVPAYRVDVLREADVVEEILRIYGYDNIAFPHGLKSSISIAPKPDPEKIQNKLSDFLVAKGFSEIMGMSLTKTKYASLFPSEDVVSEREVALLNPLSSDLGVMRQSLLFSGLESIALNQNHRNADLRLFEFGKVYQRKNEGGYTEKKVLSLLITGLRFPENWNQGKDMVSFTDIKSVVDDIIAISGISLSRFSALEHAHFSEGINYEVNGKTMAILGNVDSSLLKHFDIRQPVLYANILVGNLVKALPKNEVQYHEPSKFPAVRRDLSLLLDRAVTFGEIEKISFETEKKLLRRVGLFDVYEGKNLDAGKKSYAVSFVLQDSSKTMTDQQVESVMEKIRKNLSEKLGAVLRS